MDSKLLDEKEICVLWIVKNAASRQSCLLANRVFPQMALHHPQMLSNMWIICTPEGSSDLPPRCDECGSFIGNGNGNDDDGDRFWPQSWFHTEPWICHSPWMMQPFLRESTPHFTACRPVLAYISIYYTPLHSDLIATLLYTLSFIPLFTWNRVSIFLWATLKLHT